MAGHYKCGRPATWHLGQTAFRFRSGRAYANTMGNRHAVRAADGMGANPFLGQKWQALHCGTRSIHFAVRGIRLEVEGSYQPFLNSRRGLCPFGKSAYHVHPSHISWDEIHFNLLHFKGFRSLSDKYFNGVNGSNGVNGTHRRVDKQCPPCTKKRTRPARVALALLR